jgi:RNA polymerase sigma factor (sigma-70 family)
MPLWQADGLAAALFEKYRRPLRLYLRSLTGSVDAADDLSQEVFLRVVRGATTYEPRERERAWLFRIARNLAADRARRDHVRGAPAPDCVDAAQPATQLVQLNVREALAHLSDTERQAFLLCEIAGLSYQEIAEALDLTVPAVRSLLFRARMQLRVLVLPAPPRPRTFFRRGDSDDIR